MVRAAQKRSRGLPRLQDDAYEPLWSYLEDAGVPFAVHPGMSGLIPYDQLAGWPRLPIFLAQATGYWPTVQTVVAQVALTAVYLFGALYTFVIRPRRARRRAEVGQPPALATPALR